MYLLAADLVVLAHFGFIVFAVAGGFLLLKWRWLAFVHVPAVLWAAMIEFFGWICPLTPLENWLRRHGEGAPYGEGFIAHYLLPVLYPQGMTRGTQTMFGLAVIGINIGVYSYLVRKMLHSDGGG